MFGKHWISVARLLYRNCTSVPPFFINIGTCSLPGRTPNRENEDCFNTIKFSQNVQYFGVFDGHNGTFVSNFVNNAVPAIIEDKLLSNHNLYDSVFEILNETLLLSFDECQNMLTEAILNRKDLKRREMVGSTAVVGVLVDGRYLTIANVGDSKAILCREGKPIELTVEHIPDNQEEANRIEMLGGWIDWDSRFTPLVEGRLSMTRSFGNLLLKPDIVISKPSLSNTVIDEFKDSFVVLCSDGITHSMTNEEIIYVIGQHEDPKEAAEDLTTTAHQYGSVDDTTAVVVPLGAWRNIEIKSNRYNYSMFRTVVGGRSGG